jgi:hypothetical protein
MADASKEHEDTNQPFDVINDAPSPPQTEASQHIEQDEATVTASSVGTGDDDKDTAATLIHIPLEEVHLRSYTGSRFFPTSDRMNQGSPDQILCTSI